MNVRLMLLSTVVAASSLFAMSANAHDPREFDRMMSAPQAKKIPTTCDELADVYKFSNDVSSPDIKTLKAACDANKKPAAKAKVTAKQAASKTR